ncbi:hypothetical protein BDA99DRAFT_563704 [Phascolomyces articulosus]|uniref:Uncharacterized protein n=1 Tax=Phascolomyces articulosus TaxID=60185 RepID=A0AAD5JS79_9FUNG|nr:hypothetical protein BDA99DRAFT_563704 [Phascolomyces articulosus]
MSSQICVFCFQPLSHLPGIVIKDGIKVKKCSHGALVCDNVNCPAVLVGYTTFNRDAVGATASLTTTTTTTSYIELDQIYRSVSPSSTFLHGAGQTSMDFFVAL